MDIVPLCRIQAMDVALLSALDGDREIDLWSK